MTSFHLRIPLRWVDLDAQGHVNNAAVVDYLQEARVRFLLGGPNAHLLGNGVIVVAHQVRYLGAIEYSSTPLDVHLRVGDVGASRFVVGYDLAQHGRSVAHAATTLCVFDFEAGRPARLTAAERAWFADHSGSVEAFPPLGAWEVGPGAHEYPLSVRWSDLDSYGHVNNATLFGYFGEARVALTSALLPSAIRSAPDAGVPHVWLVARQDVRYLAQLEHRMEEYRVRTSVAELGRTSATLVAQVEDPRDGTVFVRAYTVLVHADAAGRPTSLPDELRAEHAAHPAVLAATPRARW